eukprot:233189_1
MSEQLSDSDRIIDANINITNLCKDLLITCCNYLLEQEVYEFCKVCKYFRNVGMHPGAIFEIESWFYPLQKAANLRYSLLKSLYIQNLSLQTIPEVLGFNNYWLKSLQHFQVSQFYMNQNSQNRLHEMFKTPFENLRSLNFEHLKDESKYNIRKI